MIKIRKFSHVGALGEAVAALTRGGLIHQADHLRELETWLTRHRAVMGLLSAEVHLADGNPGEARRALAAVEKRLIELDAALDAEEDRQAARAERKAAEAKAEAKRLKSAPKASERAPEPVGGSPDVEAAEEVPPHFAAQGGDLDGSPDVDFAEAELRAMTPDEMLAHGLDPDTVAANLAELDAERNRPRKKRAPKKKALARKRK